MTPSASSVDVRNIITPDAFSLDPDLLGTPLAPPGRRAVALVIDLILVGFLQLLGWKLLGGVAALLFFRIATRPPEGERPSRARKFAVGCLGVFVLLLVVIALGAIPSMFRDVTTVRDSDLSQAPGEISLGQVAGGIGAAIALAAVEDSAEAVELLMAMGQTAQALQSDGDLMDEDDLRTLLQEAMSNNKTLDGASVVEGALERMRTEDILPPAETAELSEEDTPLAGGSDGEDGTAGEGGSDAPERANPEGAPTQELDPAVRDSFDALASRIRTLEDDLGDAEEELDETRAALDDAEVSTLFTWIKDAADEAGLLFGWGTVYLTLFLALWGGRTPGKKLLGMRVVRLNGSPIGLFLALERAGGYAAGFATGLLGFAQILWDPNRQGIHDKIAETVVILEGRPKVPTRWIVGREEGMGGSPLGDQRTSAPKSRVNDRSASAADLKPKPRVEEPADEPKDPPLT